MLLNVTFYGELLVVPAPGGGEWGNGAWWTWPSAETFEALR